MADGREEREELERQKEQQKREDRSDWVDRETPDDWQSPERGGS